MITAADINTKLDKLDALGSADAIAWELEAQGIKAFPDSAYFCAIAQYLGNPSNVDDWGGVAPSVSVNQRRVICFDEMSMVRTPALVADFITKFDQGAYPALVAENA